VRNRLGIIVKFSTQADKLPNKPVIWKTTEVSLCSLIIKNAPKRPRSCTAHFCVLIKAC